MTKMSKLLNYFNNSNDPTDEPNEVKTAYVISYCDCKIEHRGKIEHL